MGLRGHKLDNNLNPDETCDEELNKRSDEVVTYAKTSPTCRSLFDFRMKRFTNVLGDRVQVLQK